MAVFNCYMILRLHIKLLVTATCITVFCATELNLMPSICAVEHRSIVLRKFMNCSQENVFDRF